MGTIRAMLVPKTYKIIFDMDLEEIEKVPSEISGMDEFLNVVIEGGVPKEEFSTTYQWSHGKSVTDAVPSCDGFVFMGWYAEGVRVDTDGSFTVADDRTGNITLTALWLADIDNNDIPPTATRRRSPSTWQTAPGTAPADRPRRYSSLS